MKKLIVKALMLAVATLAGCAEVSHVNRKDASSYAFAPPAAEAAATPATDRIATTPATNGTPPQPDDQDAAVMTTADWINGIPVVITPHDSKKNYGCATKYNSLAAMYEIMTYNGHVITQKKKRQLLEKMKVIKVDPNLMSENQGYTADCFDWRLAKAATASQATARAATPAATAPASQTRIAIVTPAVVEPEPVAAHPATTKKTVVRKSPSYDFYADFIKKAGYTVKGWQKKNCLEDDGRIGPKTRKVIDDIVAKTGPDPCDEEKAADPSKK